MNMTSKLVASVGLAVLTTAARLQGAVPLGSNVLHQITLLAEEKAARTPAQLKMDSHLIYAMKQAGGRPVAAGLPMLQLSVTPDVNGKVLVDITGLITPALLNAIDQAG